MAEEDLRHLAEIFVQQRNQLVGRKAFGDFGEAANIAEQDRHLLRLAAGLKVLVGIALEQRDYSRRNIARKCPADTTLLALFKDHSEAGDGRIVRDQRSGRDHKSQPHAVAGERYINDDRERGQSDDHGCSGNQWADFSEPVAEPDSEQQDERDIE